jgi:hypothetical protein
VGLKRAQAFEGRVKRRFSHLLAEALSLMASPEPRAGRDRPPGCEALCGDVLDADWFAVNEDSASE